MIKLNLPASDTSRLTYIVNELQESGKIKWVLDKKGVKIKKFVVTPLLEYLKGEIMNYMEENSFCTKKHDLLKLQAATEIYNIIDKEILTNDIVRYMAPYFTLMKEDEKVNKEIKQILTTQFSFNFFEHFSINLLAYFSKNILF